MMKVCPQCRRPVMEGQAYCDSCGCRLFLIPDQAMIDAARAGNQNALSQLYTLAYDGVYYTVHAMIRDEETVLDVVQDSFIRGFENLDRLQDPSRFAAWMKSIARNMAVDELRRKKPLLFSQMAEDQQSAVLEFADDRPENLPAVALDRQETARLVREILDSLPEEQRLAVALYYYEGLSVRQVAQRLGIPENTVKSRLSLGRKKIETKVRSLERQGTRLYSLSPTAFLLLLLRQQSGHPSYGFQEVFDAVRQTLLQDGAIPAAYHPAAASGSRAAAGKAAGGTAVKAAAAGGHSVAAKIVAIVLAASVALGGGAYGIHLLGRRSAAGSTPTPPPDTVPSLETVEPGFPVSPADPAAAHQQALGRWTTADGSAELWIQSWDEQGVTFSLYVPGQGSLNNVTAAHQDGESVFDYEDGFNAAHYAYGSLTSDLDGHFVLSVEDYGSALGVRTFVFPNRSSLPDYVTLYGPVLDAYRAHEQNGGGLVNWYGDEEGYVHVGLSGVTHFGYFLWDLDNNGTPELILGALYPDEEYAENSWLNPTGYDANLILDLFTLQNGSPVYITNSGDRYRYSMTTDGQIYFEGSGGAAYSYLYLYRLNGAALELQDGLCIDGGEDKCYRVQDPEDWQHTHDQHIPYEEFSQRAKDMSELGHEHLGLIQPYLKPLLPQ